MRLDIRPYLRKHLEELMYKLHLPDKKALASTVNSISTKYYPRTLSPPPNVLELC